MDGPVGGAKRRHVHLGDTVRINDLGGDPVSIEHLDPRIVVPGTDEEMLVALAPFGVDVGDEELLGGLLGCLDLDRERHVEGLTVLGVEIVAVPLRGKPGVAVRRNDEIAIHFQLSSGREPGSWLGE